MQARAYVRAKLRGSPDLAFTVAAESERIELDSPAARELTLRTLRQLAVANTLKGRHSFTTSDVASALHERPEELALFIRLAEVEEIGLPLLSQKQAATIERPGVYEFIYISVQDALFAQHLHVSINFLACNLPKICLRQVSI